MVVAYIGLGSNLAGACKSPAQQVSQAFAQLASMPQTRLLAQSPLYRSAPMGPQDQPDYINAVAQIETALSPESLLDALQTIENRQGRERNQRWGARTLDLDILLYGEVEMRSERLTLPHPGLCERDFVVLPLLDIAPQLSIPGHGKLADIARHCPRYGAKRVGEVA